MTLWRDQFDNMPTAELQAKRDEHAKKVDRLRSAYVAAGRNTYRDATERYRAAQSLLEAYDNLLKERAEVTDYEAAFKVMSQRLCYLVDEWGQNAAYSERCGEDGEARMLRRCARMARKVLAGEEPNDLFEDLKDSVRDARWGN